MKSIEQILIGFDWSEGELYDSNLYEIYQSDRTTNERLKVIQIAVDIQRNLLLKEQNKIIKSVFGYIENDTRPAFLEKLIMELIKMNNN